MAVLSHHRPALCPPPGRGARLVCLLAAAFYAVVLLSAQAESALPEDEIKAAFLFNFARFVEWPHQSATDHTLVLGVLGRETFAATLDQTVRGKTVSGRPLLVKRLAGPQEAKACHILFVAASEKARFRQILDALPPAGLLTVGEIDQFAQRGGIINFVKEANKIRFEINIDAANRAGIRISSRLLQLAHVVRDAPSTP